MTAREEFEAWAEPEGILLGRVISDERYESMTTEWAFRAWQAAKGRYLEEAAKECEKAVEDYGIHSNFICAKVIRALKD